MADIMSITLPRHRRSKRPPFSDTNFRDLLLMSVNNPYAQAGWVNPENPWSINQPQPGRLGGAPSVYGALPQLLVGQTNRPDLLEFQLSGFNPDILNCIVMGPNARHCFSVTTGPPSAQRAACTFVKNGTGNVVSTIEWDHTPIVQVTGMVSKCLASALISLSPELG